MMPRCTLPGFMSMQLVCGHWAHASMYMAGPIFSSSHATWPCPHCHFRRMFVQLAIWPHEEPVPKTGRPHMG